MSTEPGTQPVVLFVNGEPVSTLNPLPTTGGGFAALATTGRAKVCVLVVLDYR